MPRSITFDDALGPYGYSSHERDLVETVAQVSAQDFEAIETGLAHVRRSMKPVEVWMP